MLCTIQDLGDPETVNNYGAVNSVEESPLVSKIDVNFTIHVCYIILCCRRNLFILFQLSDGRPTSANEKEASVNSSDGNVTEEETVNRKPKRLKSLDTVRGLALLYSLETKTEVTMLLSDPKQPQSAGFHHSTSYGH